MTLRLGCSALTEAGNEAAVSFSEAEVFEPQTTDPQSLVGYQVSWSPGPRAAMRVPGQ